jgi:DNA-binding MarR family transcriptional regulator
MAVLLSGAGNMDNYTLYRAAGTPALAVVAPRLEKLGWVKRQGRMEGGMEYSRYRYVLTPEGRAALLEILGLTEFDISERWADAPLKRGESAE